MIFRIGICDDNPNYLKMLEKEFEYFKVQNVDVQLEMHEDGKNLLDKIYEYDLLILDIQMPNITGLDIKEKVEKNDIPIIFFTNYDKYMKFSFGKNVYGFVKKDDMLELKEIVKKIIFEKASNEVIIIANQKMNLSDIIYLKADTVYTEIYTNDRQIIIRKALREFLDKLDCLLFFRVHRTYAVNMKYIKNITKNNVRLSNGVEIPISRTRYDNFIKRYIKFLNGDIIK